MKTNHLYIGHSTEILKEFPDESIHCVVTSPPYFGLRSYLSKDNPLKNKEIGLEETVTDYIQNLLSVFAEIKRVLHPLGTVWLNLGDSYNGSGKAGVKQSEHINFGKVLQKEKRYGKPMKLKNLKSKDLIGIPWAVAFALRDQQGWWLRQDIIWNKPNPMPEPTKDRCTKSHEYIFLLSKSQKYWFDYESIKEPSVDFYGSEKRYKAAFGGKKNEALLKTNQVHIKPIGLREFDGTRNKRSVWTVSTQAYTETHFAVFPEKLIIPCIQAGCPEKCCPHCKAPWIRVVESFEHTIAGHSRGKKATKIMERNDNGTGAFTRKTSIAESWKPSCTCPEHKPIPGIVLDPFFGSGTVGTVAVKYGRDYIGIDLNENNKKLVKKRKIKKGLFSLQDTNIK